MQRQPFGMGFMAYSPLGRGLLAGQFHDIKEIPQGDQRHRNPRFQAGNIEHNLRLLAQIEEMARERSATPAQIALAWLMAQGSNIIPIPGAKSREHLDQNLQAMAIQLSPEYLNHIDALMPPGAAAGTRSALADMARLNL